MKLEKDVLYESRQEMTNGAPWSLSKCWECAIHEYGLPFVNYCMTIAYAIYNHCTALNVALFLVKIVPTGVYVSNAVRNIYVSSRERMRLNQIEIDDIQLQIQILNNKMSVRDAEFMERAEELRKGSQRLRAVRARVREVIAADEGLRQSIDDSVSWEDIANTHLDSPPEEREYILQLLKELKYEEEEEEAAEVACACACAGAGASTEPAPHDPPPADTDDKQNCRVKIVKVTNVYKVAYLKHFIKQKKMRRATKHAILKKKVETVKQFLDDWQKTLDMVTNIKLSILNLDSKYVEGASQEAMGDYTKQDMRDFSDNDSDVRNYSDIYYEQPVLNWTQNTYRNFPSSFEEVPEPCGQYARGALCDLPEETVSQVAIEVRSEASEEYECRDVISI